MNELLRTGLVMRYLLQPTQTGDQVDGSGMRCRSSAKLINLSTQLNRQGRGWRNSCSSKGYFSCSPTGLLVPASTKASKTDLQVYVELIVKACPSSPPDVQASKRDAFLLFICWTFSPVALLE